MQVILGSGGAIGIDLARELKKFDNKIRLASRNPKKVNTDDELFRCDLTLPGEVDRAVSGADVAYLTAGLPYKIKVWQKQWPLIMQNVISACKKHKTKLVFFDNIYMYNPEKLNPMTEETEVRPSSKKGKVRAEIAQMILDETAAGNLKALIARAADFYGPGINNSVLNEMTFKNFKAGKKANWFSSLDKKHNFTYTPDAAKATALLGNTEEAYGQVWHLPTAEAYTGKQWIEMIATEMGVQPKVQVAPKFLVSVMGLFNSIMKEFVEMLYQYDRDYVFDSSKFETKFKMKPTPVKEAIKEVAKTF
ncbi:MAG: NAD-dependent epimerase/dehydratase family protein [Prolixibacteraceae bacterium]|nr:NAD-dependent epimerase/dehydratase family protein [Prolixibacteraceae bacterium]